MYMIHELFFWKNINYDSQKPKLLIIKEHLL